MYLTIRDYCIQRIKEFDHIPQARKDLLRHIA